MSEQEEIAAIPLVEERVSVSKTEVETGRVRVRIGVEERQEQVRTEALQDVVEIRRVRKNEAVSELPGVRLEGDTTIIPVVEEVVVVEKRLVLVEEIHVLRRTETQACEVPITLRSEKASVERNGEAEASLEEADATPQWKPL
jgi:uncharacterized protein (TIGR02271 family)